MSQVDLVLDNVAGATYRATHNQITQAIVTNHSGSSEPPTLFAGMLWWDTGTNVLKRRNGSNTAWVTVAAWNGTTYIPYRDGTALGTAATKDVGTAANNVVQLDGSARLPAVDGSQLTNVAWKTGDVRLSVHTLANVPAGWLVCDGCTIGNASSGANYADASMQALFEFLYANIAQEWCGVSGGRSGNATVDWQAGKRINLPDARGSTLLVRDNMGHGAAGRVTSASPNGGYATWLAARGGTEMHTPSWNEMPPHVHSGGFGAGGENYEGGDNFYRAGQNTGSAGAGWAHNNMPPWFSLNLIIKV